jgi:hypothetical protein
LFARWVTARQAASAGPADTVARLLRWMTNDQYGFWSHVEDDIASALDEAGRAACAGHLKRLLDTGTESASTRRQIGKLLRAVHIAQRDADAYIAQEPQSSVVWLICSPVTLWIRKHTSPVEYGPRPAGWACPMLTA